MKYLVLGWALLFTVTGASAASLDKISIYGSVRAGMWWDQVNRVLDDTTRTTSTDTIVGGDSLPRTNFNLLPYGTLGIKYTDARFSTTFEMGVLNCFTNGYIGGGTTALFSFIGTKDYVVRLKRFFAEVYLTDKLTFLVGKTDVPACFSSSNQLYYTGNSFGNTGNLYVGMLPLLELRYSTFKNVSALGLEAKLAAIKVDTCSFAIVRPFPNELTSADSKYPKIESSVEGRINIDPLSAELKLVGGFQQYMLRFGRNFSEYPEVIKPVNSYIAGAHGGIKIGPVWANADFATGQNLGPYGVYIGSPFLLRGQGGVCGDLNAMIYPTYQDTASLQESHVSEADIIVGVKAGPRLSFEGGAGWVKAQLGSDSLTKAQYPNWHDVYAGYFQVEFKATDNLIFTPEIGYYYYGPKKYYGSMPYFGFETRVDF